MPTLPSTTARLTLTPLSLQYLADVFAVYGDPATWQHLPSGRHERSEQSAALITSQQNSWEQWGLGQWGVIVSEAGSDEGLPAGTFIGTGGVSMTEAGMWNLGYRLAPRSWGRGFATELATAAVAAAAITHPAAPVSARVLSSNQASAVVAQRAGLMSVWEGPTTDAVADGVRREIYADRTLTNSQLEWLVTRG